ncbi:hypothetical protein ALQ89_01533 [Pseudomonas amygdali pv. tabaci]|uniref:Uncharacterized protein n=1 Tax=Pseudomonas amygdali pv. tabaci TaxID=322 RepID=A0AAX1VZD2_PSEAJ|nr:Unknown protein sequence [Pseudomonas amygdali pv. tabaci]RML83705.1 hypothetical protein ALQ89_01533 [Pseudomonas amygdali pv. tabaci]BCS43144.1 hypothetical protein Pta6605_14750 [Pseudomonas amygdali pv. tabaci]
MDGLVSYEPGQGGKFGEFACATERESRHVYEKTGRYRHHALVWR